MGYYVDPTDRSKEQWLHENGIVVLGPSFTEDSYPVCLVDNGPFTAAGICFDLREADAFNQPTDHRPRQWFLVPRSKLIEVCPQVAKHLT